MVLQFREEIIFEQIGDRGFIFDQEHEILFSANDVGRLILECIEKGNATPSQIAKEIITRYEVEEVIANKDVSEFIVSLNEKKILK